MALLSDALRTGEQTHSLGPGWRLKTMIQRLRHRRSLVLHTRLASLRMGLRRSQLQARLRMRLCALFPSEEITALLRLGSSALTMRTFPPAPHPVSSLPLTLERLMRIA